MNAIVFEVAIILVLLIANGVFAMSEIAVVSARKPRLRRLAEQGSSTARVALDLAESPNRFLATVQIGITLVGIFAGAFGGARLSTKLAGPLQQLPGVAPYAGEIAFAIVVIAITYLSLVIGELVPKRIGLNSPERISMLIARPMAWMSRAAGPLVSFLGASTDAMLRLIGLKPAKETAVSEDEVRVLMQEGMRAGAFNRIETEIVHSALELDQLTVREIMTPRPKVIWINQDEPHEKVWHKIVVSNHSHFPVYKTNRDNVVGVVSVKGIYANLAAGTDVSIRNIMVPPLIVPESQIVLRLVETFKTSARHIALVTDEFGSIVGLVTLHDVMEAIIGEFPSLDARSRPAAKRRDDGSWLMDGMLSLELVERALPGFAFADGSYTEYQTLAGFVVKQLGHVPKEGETFEMQGYVFEVLDMDRHRVDKVLVMAPRQDQPAKS